MAFSVLIPVAAVVALVAGLAAALAPRRATTVTSTDVVTSPAAHRDARQHAAVVGGVAWAVLALLAAAVPTVASGSHRGGLVLGCAPAAAGLAFLLVSAVGERTWPAPTGTLRRASLVRRTALDVGPRPLVVLLAAWCAALLLVLLATGTTADVGGTTVTLRLDEQLTASSGPYPGAPYGVPLGVATGLVVLASAGVLHLVARRPAVTGLSVADDAALRRASAGRVLAGVQLVVGATLAGVLAFTGLALRGASTGTYGVDDVWTSVAEPLPAALAVLALVGAAVVAVTCVAAAATGLVRATRASALPVPA
ncbi:hypothetical protein [Cellulomonas sp. B6]|uniref:hypothetical protein n=1 Tax=Cellulomonas sp. B6 TaxID=1295626 RepID=UPI00073C576C|nr:hypothetical protein [Cellulomonas sp. B6]KSW13723.1 hypothetical protein ATM99_03455 [Cellulomonas sp. B6]